MTLGWLFRKRTARARWYGGYAPGEDEHAKGDEANAQPDTRQMPSRTGLPSSRDARLPIWERPAAAHGQGTVSSAR